MTHVVLFSYILYQTTIPPELYYYLVHCTRLASYNKYPLNNRTVLFLSGFKCHFFNAHTWKKKYYSYQDLKLGNKFRNLLSTKNTNNLLIRNRSQPNRVQISPVSYSYIPRLIILNPSHVANGGCIGLCWLLKLQCENTHFVPPFFPRFTAALTLSLTQGDTKGLSLGQNKRIASFVHALKCVTASAHWWQKNDRREQKPLSRVDYVCVCR